MSEVPELVLISTVVPDPENSGGPSGLPWELLEAIKQAGWQVQVQVIPLATARAHRRLTQLAVPINTLRFEKTDADVYIVYPFYLGRLVPREFRSRTIVLGPDASSMLYARFARIESGWRRWRSRCLSWWFACQERWASQHLAGIAVVGRNDARWLRRFTGSNGVGVLYVPHPVLHAVVKRAQEVDSKASPRLIFGGDLALKYVGDFFESLNHALINDALRAANCEVIVVGKGNRYIYDSIVSRFPEARYMAWVDNYASLCDPLRDVHAMPLMAGAGTKNRTLTALAMNVIVLSTPIGLENIDGDVLRAATVHRFRSSADFPRALAMALGDLQARRSAGAPPPPPPIERIAKAFYASTCRLLQTALAYSSSSSRK